jgi:hypothetical protein
MAKIEKGKTSPISKSYLSGTVYDPERDERRYKTWHDQ